MATEGPIYEVSLCDACMAEVRERGAILGLGATWANRAYLFSSPNRDPLNSEAWASRRDVAARLKSASIDPKTLPPLTEEGELAAVYRPFAPCGPCQAHLAEFTLVGEGYVFFSRDLATRLLRHVNRRQRQVKAAERDEIEQLAVAAIGELDRAFEPMRRRSEAEAERYRRKHNLPEDWYLRPGKSLR